MKKLALSIILVLLFLVSCGGKNYTVDYTTDEAFEAALNNGIDGTGKIVTLSVDKFEPDSAFGYNIWSGEHLNFCSTSNPNVKVGSEITVKITRVKSVMGSYIIYYELLDK